MTASIEFPDSETELQNFPKLKVQGIHTDLQLLLLLLLQIVQFILVSSVCTVRFFFFFVFLLWMCLSGFNYFRKVS